MRILFLTYYKTEASSFYRSGGVAADLCRKGYNVTVGEWNRFEIDWQVLSMYDIIMMQRPYTAQAYNVAAYIKKMNKPLWVDYDDNLLGLNPENPVFDVYSSPEVKNNIIRVLQLADVVSVTTEALKETFSIFNDNIHVVPNAFNDMIFREKPKKRKKMILWRGTNSHILDVMTFGKAIDTATEDFPDWRFNYMGYDPDFLKPHGYIKEADIILYHKAICAMSPSLMQIPLHDDPFNHCKSNIACIEGTFAGAICLCPLWWKIPGTMEYKDAEQYYVSLRAVMKGEIDIEKQNQITWEYITDNLLLSKVNELRIKLIESL
jgi:glycosyltransferase involved in cell wall biosynthesis